MKVWQVRIIESDEAEDYYFFRDQDEAEKFAARAREWQDKGVSSYAAAVIVTAEEVLDECPELEEWFMVSAYHNSKKPMLHRDQYWSHDVDWTEGVTLRRGFNDEVTSITVWARTEAEAQRLFYQAASNAWGYNPLTDGEDDPNQPLREVARHILHSAPELRIW